MSRRHRRTAPHLTQAAASSSAIVDEAHLTQLVSDFVYENGGTYNADGSLKLPTTIGCLTIRVEGSVIHDYRVLRGERVAMFDGARHGNESVTQQFNAWSKSVRTVLPISPTASEDT